MRKSRNLFSIFGMWSKGNFKIISQDVNPTVSVISQLIQVCFSLCCHLHLRKARKPEADCQRCGFSMGTAIHIETIDRCFSMAKCLMNYRGGSSKHLSSNGREVWVMIKQRLRVYCIHQGLFQTCSSYSSLLHYEASVEWTNIMLYGTVK